MLNILLGKKIRNLFDLKNIFFLRIFSPFSSSVFLLLRKKMYFPSPIIFPLFLLCFFFSTKKYSFLLQTLSSFSCSVFLFLRENLFSFSKYFPPFPSLFFASTEKVEKRSTAETSTGSEFLSFFVLYSRLLADFLSLLGKWVKLIKFDAENECFCTW